MWPPSTTSPAMVAAVSVATATGSHQAAAPMAMRVGMAMGAARGIQEMARAQPVSGLPMAAEGDEVDEDEDDADRAGAALSVFGPRCEGPEGTEDGGVQGVPHDEEDDRPGENGAAHGGEVHVANGGGGDKRGDG